MKRVSRVVCVVLMLLITAMLAVGCGSPSSSSGGSSSGAKCQFKNSDGSRTCTSTATHGQLCDYHYQLLDDTYNDIKDNWN